MEEKYRLKNSSSFRYIFKNGRKIYTELFILYMVKAKNIKVGVCVSKRVGNSVIRNKVKRRIKEAFKENMHAIKDTYNFVIVARKSIVEASYLDIKEGIRKAFIKEKIYSKVGDI